MSRIKTDAKAVKRDALNTTIESETLQAFKEKCKSLNLPMNMLLTEFMRGFCENKFVLTIGKNNKIEVDIED